MITPCPENEDDRIVTVKRLHILDTEPEAFFDRIAEVGREIFDCMVAGVSFVDSGRVWFTSVSGRSLS